MFSDFVRAYTEALREVEIHDEDFDGLEFSEQAKNKIDSECYEFYFNNADRFNDDSRAGADFYFTRNRHGAGFWDGEYSDDDGRYLTELSHEYGPAEAYVGDDGMIHLA